MRFWLTRFKQQYRDNSAEMPLHIVFWARVVQFGGSDFVVYGALIVNIVGGKAILPYFGFQPYMYLHAFPFYPS